MNLGTIEEISITRRFWKKDYPRFRYQPSSWKSKGMTGAEYEDANFLMVIPKQVAKQWHNLREAREEKESSEISIEDKISKLPIQRIYNFFKDFDQYTIVEEEPIKLIKGIAQNVQGIWNYYKELLESASMLTT